MPRFLRGRTMTNAWREPTDAVGLADAAVAGRLAREAANPFGRKLAARDLLARFGGDTPDGRRRARAALQLAGVASEPPIETAQPHQFLALHPAAPTVAQAQAADGEDAPVIAVVAPRRRVAIGALGLLGLAVVLVAALLMRGMAGDGGEDAAFALPSGTTPPAATAPPATATTPGPAVRRAPAARSRRRPRVRPAVVPVPPPPRGVRLRIAVTERSYVCVAEDDGTTIFDGFVVEERPLVVSRPHVRFRIGVGTAAITANGRPVEVEVAPSGYRVGPRMTRQLSPNDPVCR